MDEKAGQVMSTVSWLLQSGRGADAHHAIHHGLHTNCKTTFHPDFTAMWDFLFN